MIRTHPTRRLAILGVLAALAVGTLGVSPAVAQTDSVPDPFATIDTDGDQNDSVVTDALETAEWARSLVSVSVDRVRYTIHKVTGDTRSASAIASDVSTYVNQRSGTIRQYANAHMANGTDKTNYDVIAVQFSDANGNTAVRYAVATVNTSNASYSTFEVVSNTTRTVDMCLQLGEYASAEAKGTVTDLYTQYVATNSTIPEGERRQLTAKYGPQIDIKQGCS